MRTFISTFVLGFFAFSIGGAEAFSVGKYVLDEMLKYPELETIKISLMSSPDFVDDNGVARKRNGFYVLPQKDTEPEIVLYSKQSKRDAGHTLFHEFCHHRFYTDLAPDQRQEWDDLFEEHDWSPSSYGKKNSDENFADWCALLLYNKLSSYAYAGARNFHRLNDIPQAKFIEKYFGEAYETAEKQAPEMRATRTRVKINKKRVSLVRRNRRDSRYAYHFKRFYRTTK